MANAQSKDTSSLANLTLSRRKRVILAPDAYVLLNQSPDVKSKDESTTTDLLKFNPYITSISTNLSTEDIGSASITMTIPRNKLAGFFKDGHLAFTRMDQVHIFMKSRFMKNKQPKNVPVFWGLVSSVDYAESPGSMSVTLTCKGILHWWDLATYITNPSNVDSLKGGSPGETYDNILHNLNPYEIIYALSSHFSADTIPHNASLAQIAMRGTVMDEIPPVLYESDAQDIVSHWDSVFNHMRNLLRLHGAQFVAVEGEKLDTLQAIQKQVDENNKALNTGRVAALRKSSYQPNGHLAFEESLITSFTPLTVLDSSSKMETVAKSRLAIAREVAESINYEFFLDTDGKIVFKPPYYNLDTSNLLEYSIDDEDIMRWSFRETEDGVITRLEVTGNPIFEYSSPNSNYFAWGVYEDPSMTRTFGQRVKQVSLQFLRNDSICADYAVAQMSYHKMGQYGGSLTILGRPELRLGIPVFIKSLRMFAYITGINHDISFGGSFTTTLQLAGFRRPYKPYGKTVALGETNVCARKELTAIKNQATLAAAKAASATDKLKNIYLAQGKWVEFKNNFPVYQVIPAQLNSDGRVDSPIVPLSDENGFEVIGGFPYGRGVVILPDGEFKLTEKADKFFQDQAQFNKREAAKLDDAKKAVKPLVEPVTPVPVPARLAPPLRGRAGPNRGF